jgi:uncharacterized protein (TIGR02453 family)
MFTADLFEFLTALADHNDRDWFNAHKADYERAVQAPALAFVSAFADRLPALSDAFLAIPKKQGGALFRIHRDTRFSANKTPYKTHTGMQFRHRMASRDVHAPGFYLHLEPGASMVGFGMWQPPNPTLNQVRDAIVADPDAWRAVRDGLDAAGMSLMGDSLKRAPRGYDPAHPHADDLRRKSLAASRAVPDDAVLSPDFLDQFTDLCRQGAPLIRFECEALDLPF